MDRLDGARILIYSHDTFGLGHLRRCRTIAHALVDQFKDLSVLILSGSPIIGSFDFRARVDFVRIPGVIKLRNGDYTSLGLHIDLEQTLAIRASIIRHTAEVFAPDLFLVDKEPLGLRGEVAETLEMLSEQGAVNVLGIRDILDEPEAVSREWDRKGVLPALENNYDEIWVYGRPEMADPLDGVAVDQSIRNKIKYTGYLRREAPSTTVNSSGLPVDGPFVLITSGGGGDGEALVDWVVRAYETDPDILQGLVVLGPFMPVNVREKFRERIDRLAHLEAITFHPHLEQLMEHASGVVAMGGYNTFCEILSFDVPAIIVPRSKPRREQLIRAQRASELGLLRFMDGDGERDASEMSRALRALPNQPAPSLGKVDGLLDGLDVIGDLTRRAVETRDSVETPRTSELA